MDGIRRTRGSRRVPRAGLLAGPVLLVVVLAACVGDDVAVVPAPEAEQSPPAIPAPTEEAGELTILHAFTGTAASDGLQAIIAAFNELHPDILVREESSSDLASTARTRLDAGVPPDIIIHPQPRLLQELVDRGAVRALDGLLDRPWLESEIVTGLLDTATFDGALLAVPVRVSLRSLVWYSPRMFTARDYGVPADWGQLTELTDRMIIDGLSPWCIGIESGPTTGWVVADWVEDIILRSLGSEDHDRLVRGELRFSSAEVEGAIERYMAPIWTDERSVLGGRDRIISEPFWVSVTGLLGETPECGMHRQADFLEVFMDQVELEVEFGTDLDFFALPGILPGDRPLLGTVEQAALYSDNAAAVRFMQFLATKDAGRAAMSRSAFVSPFAAVLDRAQFADASAVRASEVLDGATGFRSVGWEQMPTDVGSSSLPGSFWTEMTKWVAGEKSLIDALSSIDERYASSR